MAGTEDAHHVSQFNLSAMGNMLADGLRLQTMQNNFMVK
jgi:hypothetical protein